jgi:hypothetical protein
MFVNWAIDIWLSWILIMTYQYQLNIEIMLYTNRLTSIAKWGWWVETGRLATLDERGGKVDLDGT